MKLPGRRNNNVGTINIILLIFVVVVLFHPSVVIIVSVECLVVNKNNSNNNNNYNNPSFYYPNPAEKPNPTIVQIIPATQNDIYPPVILLGGIAQTKSSWDHHLTSLSKNRKVIVYECLGQGLGGGLGGGVGETIATTAVTTMTMTPDDNDDNNISKNVNNNDNDSDSNNNNDCDAYSLPGQAQRLLETLNYMNNIISTDNDNDNNDNNYVDIVGFSFGGRVAMAAACFQQQEAQQQVQQQPNNNEGRHKIRIRKLHLTGVGCDRSDFGHLAMKNFHDIIHNDMSLRSFAWSILLSTYSSKYLYDLPEDKLERFIDHICSTNNPMGLLSILEQSEINDITDPWHVINMADRIINANVNSNNNYNMIDGKLCVGEFDKMAPINEVESLRMKLQWETPIDILSDCGHAAVMEKPRAWRESVISFLDDDGLVNE
jgi:pimeloyl-ACP methyl ester carboxylesterase